MNDILYGDGWMLNGSKLTLRQRDKLRATFRPASICAECGHVDYDTKAAAEEVDVKLLDDGRDGRFDIVVGDRVGSFEVTLEDDAGLVSVIATGRVIP